MVEVLKGDGLSVIFLDSCFAERRSFEIFSEIFDIGFHVIGLFVEVHDPCFLVKHRGPGREC